MVLWAISRYSSHSFFFLFHKDLRDGIDLMTDIETLKDLTSSPLHVLLRVGDCFFKVGMRNMAGVFKYDVPLDDDDRWNMLVR